MKKSLISPWYSHEKAPAPIHASNTLHRLTAAAADPCIATAETHSAPVTPIQAHCLRNRPLLAVTDHSSHLIPVIWCISWIHILLICLPTVHPTSKKALSCENICWKAPIKRPSIENGESVCWLWVKASWKCTVCNQTMPMTAVQCHPRASEMSWELVVPVLPIWRIRYPRTIKMSLALEARATQMSRFLTVVYHRRTALNAGE